MSKKENATQRPERGLPHDRESSQTVYTISSPVYLLCAENAAVFRGKM
jgi:hypothetical protein